MNIDNENQLIGDIIEKCNLKICFEENDDYKEIPSKFLKEFNWNIDIINDYIRINNYIEKIKVDINKYLFVNESSVNHITITNQLLRIKAEENLEKILPYINVDLNTLEVKLKNLGLCFEINPNEINSMREEINNHYLKNSYNEDNIIDKRYLDEIIDKTQSSQSYTILAKSRYGAISKDYDLLNMEDIQDYNNEEIAGEYAPILVIYRPAKYVRGEYMLDDIYSVYIKRQPLEALIKQEGLREKGRDGMGSITYIKLKYDLTNANLQDILASLYIYGQRNNIHYENIKLADIGSNKVWMTADRLKKEFKELRYYNKNITQKVKEMYDSTGEYYTQISGKYIFNTREFLHCYKTYKSKDING